MVYQRVVYLFDLRLDDFGFLFALCSGCHFEYILGNFTAFRIAFRECLLLSHFPFLFLSIAAENDENIKLIDGHRKRFRDVHAENANKIEMKKLFVLLLFHEFFVFFLIFYFKNFTKRKFYFYFLFLLFPIDSLVEM